MAMICPLCHEAMAVGFPFRMVEVRKTDERNSLEAAHAYDCLYLDGRLRIEEIIHTAG